MTYAQAIQHLLGLQVFGARPGLETTRKLSALAGNPHERLRFIHVAGTNGKGSTCAFLESIYRSAGLKVGLYTSPHLVSFRERIQINRQLIGESDAARLVSEVSAFCGESPADAQPTFFEAVTVMALKYFVEQRCDLVIWETGLGGRLDATSIVTPLASVITNVSFDHTAWLGDTLAKIAAEKAGIIKPGVPVIKAADPVEVMEVCRRTAAAQGSPFFVVPPSDTAKPPLDRIELPLPGAHQRLNAAVALATVEVLQSQLPVTAGALELGLEQTRWPGRLQIEHTPDGRTLVLDGAHNPAGAEALRDALVELFPCQRPALILGMLADKDWQAMAATLAPLADRVFTVPVASQRGLPPEDLAAAFARANPGSQAIPCASLAEALDLSAPEPLLLITGSLYLIGEALEEFGLADGQSERALNEWGGSPKI